MTRPRSAALLSLILALSLVLPLASASATPAPGTTFISELHYDNTGTDADEFVEITAPVGTDLSGWQIVRYNGNNADNAVVYSSPGAAETLPSGTVVEDQVAGYGTVVIAYPTNGLQNGPRDGLALVDPAGEVVELLSYGGTFTASNGPAAGETSTDIGATQSSSTPTGSSIERTGAIPDSYTWVAEDTNSRGLPNPGAVIDETPIPGGDEPEPCELDGLTPISDIQGSGPATPLEECLVATRGVVTADFTSGGDSGIPANQGLRGFFIEAVVADRDDDAGTSEGVFVFDGAGAFDGKIGDLVTVTGVVDEFNDVTQVSAADISVVTDPDVDPTLPAPAVLPLPVSPDDRQDVLEPLESMRVTAPELTVVEFYQIERYGEIRLSSGGVLQNPTNVVDPHDDAAYQAVVDYNAAHNIVLDDGRTGQNLDPLPYVVPGDTLRIGDQLRDEAAVLHYGFGAWRLQPIDIGELTEELRSNRTRPRPEEPPEVGGSLKVASFNVLNYFNGEGYFIGDDPDTAEGFPTARGAVTPSELERQTEKIVDAIAGFDADVVALIEIENDEGERQAAAALVDAINTELGAEVYDFIDTGRIGTDEIKLAFIYKPATVAPTGDYAILDSEVDPRFEDDRNRPALAQTFTEIATNRSVTVVNNHLKSKGSACDPEDNDPRQGNCNGVRERAAEALADWLATNPTGVEAEGTLIMGDLNAYAQEDPIRVLEAEGYRDLLEAFAPEGTTPYTYTFDATQGYLDHALADTDLFPHVTGAAAWNINADEVPAIDYQESYERFRTDEVAERYYDPSAFRSSDHDPVLVGLDLPPTCPGKSQGKGNAGGSDGCPGRSAGKGNAAYGHPRP